MDILKNKSEIINSVKSKIATRIADGIDKIDGQNAEMKESIKGVFCYIGTPYICNVFETTINIVSQEVKINDCYQKYGDDIIRKQFQSLRGDTLI